MSGLLRSLVSTILGVAFLTGNAPGEIPESIDELLDFYCYDCHGYGKKEGGIQLDELDFTQENSKHGDIWESVWRNVRTGMMPPAEGDPLEADERKDLLEWLEKGPLGIDRSNPDPGRVTVRRHNRAEYQNTIRDLLGLEFDTREHFPTDDTGYGFDTIGDVLTISPLLAERYFDAAKSIMTEAVPDDAATQPEITIWAPGFVDPSNEQDTGKFIEFMRPQTVEAKRWVPEDDEYELILDFKVEGSSEATDNTATLVLAVDGRELSRRKLGWDFQKNLRIETKTRLSAQEHTFSLHLLAGDKPKPGQAELGVEVRNLRIVGPLHSSHLSYPASYRRVIAEEHQPTSKEEWEAKSRAVIREFAGRAWRKPITAELLNRLTSIAMESAQAENSFEAGIRQAGTAILASPRFILRTESIENEQEEAPYPLIDEWALASRLSYFLWSSIPDQQLSNLAKNGQLRENLTGEIERMLQDPKANRFVADFVGQWLQARDVAEVGMRPEVVLGVSFNAGQRTFNQNLRQDMRAETEMLFQHILSERKPAIELVAADYTFLNRRLAKFYGISGVESEELKKVSGKRGGILTQGTFLVVTSNPTRTSPVKRGLFVLDNLLGTPPPPAPPNIPTLEEAEHSRGKMTMKERMVEHRKNPDCRSCHARMDPIGLAFENYTAVGTYRSNQEGKAIEVDGELVTGEKFNGVDDLKRILATDKKGDFHRCLAEKLLTYALGRGVEYYDAPAIDEIVRRMESNNGSLREAVHGVIDSVPFQRRRP